MSIKQWLKGEFQLKLDDLWDSLVLDTDDLWSELERKVNDIVADAREKGSLEGYARGLSYGSRGYWSTNTHQPEVKRPKETKCAKCGSDNIHSQWVSLSPLWASLLCNETKEHLHRRCVQCRHTWCDLGNHKKAAPEEVKRPSETNGDWEQYAKYLETKYGVSNE
jgi:predicted nucleic-acid-binding Zn-ribbon protein